MTNPLSFWHLFWRSFFPDRHSAYQQLSLQRVAIMLLFWPTFLTITLLNRLCLWLDTLLFPGFSNVEVYQPVFVVGIPRSGTTFLHRLLAGDNERFTTTALWELIFAPSILQRRFWLAFAHLDGKLGRPCSRLLHFLERRALGGLDGIHKTGLLDPEEDYLALAPHLGCFLLILPFGDAALWRLAYLDRDADQKQRQRLTGLYRQLIQRHLYVHGRNKTFLSKNPSFTPWMESLKEEFPDSRFIACIRSPHQALPSQISSILPGAKIFSGKLDLNWWRDGLTSMLQHYYEVLMQRHQQWSEKEIQIIKMKQLASAPMASIGELYKNFGWHMDGQYQHWLENEDDKARSYRSGHQYTANKLGINAAEIGEKFHPAIDYFQLAGRPHQNSFSRTD
ncbi:MAG: sulfotransferase [Alcanivoracaceae bacterium]|nr:sulfotransferase [Alcanivoracaceae bacterium]